MLLIAKNAGVNGGGVVIENVCVCDEFMSDYYDI